MAGSKLINYGTIFTRVSGMLEAGATKEKPIWYSVYQKYPPELEPNPDRPVPPQDPIPDIIYQEDLERAEINKTKGQRVVKRRRIKAI